MVKFAWTALVLLASIASYAQEKVPSVIAEEQQPNFGVVEVHASEALRRGNSVVVAGEGPRSGAQEVEIAATAPPPDDNHMWYVSLFKQKDCKPCEALLQDFHTNDYLKALIEAPEGEPHKAWAHFNVYDIHNENQKDRLSRYFVSGTPTVVIQPPRNGMWGPPKTVVSQYTGYDGDAKKLATRIMDDVRAYARKMGESGYPKPPLGPHSDVAIQSLFAPGGATQAPFTVPTADPFTPRPSQPVNFPPHLQPQPAPQPQPQTPVTPVVVQPAPAPAPQPAPGQGLLYLLTVLMSSQIVLQFVNLAMPWLRSKAAASPGRLDDFGVALLDAFVQGKISKETAEEIVQKAKGR